MPRTITLIPMLIVAGSALFAPCAAAQDAAPTVRASTPSETAGVRTLRAAPLEGEIRIDGRMDEPAWQAAEVATDFVESSPDPGAPARQRTEARVLYGPTALYVGVRLYDTDPDAIPAQLARRDATGGVYSDWVQVMIDSQHDRRTAFSFWVNPRGVKRDIYIFNDTQEDWGWNAVWDAAATVDSLGWTAEFRIPYSQLRFSGAEPAGGRVWGLQITRDMARYQSRATWSPMRPNEGGFVSRFGDLTGLVGVQPPRRLEIQPYTSARLTREPGDSSNPFYRANATGASTGFDLQYGLPAGLTLTATVNPDFGQVEQDPAVVNLSAFETFLPENRPFFVEGTDVFRFGNLLSFISQGGPQPFYSRRIGRTPQRRLAFNPAEPYVDAPLQANILGAAKVSGRTPDGWHVGVLNAVTSPAHARVQEISGTLRQEPVEPLSNYFVGRVRRDLNAGRTMVGGIVTAANRHMEPVFETLLRGSAYVAGVDAEHSWSDRRWSVSGFLSGSQVRGSEDVIAATQRSSARYFTRPDAAHLEYDPTLTALDGYSLGMALRRNGEWRGSVWYQQVSPSYEVNDLGFQGRADQRALSALWGYSPARPGRIFRNWFVRGFTSHSWNLGGDLLNASYAVRGNATFPSLWQINGTVQYSAPSLSDRGTWGGPLMRSASNWQVSGGFGSDPRRKVSGGFNAYAVDAEDGGFNRSIGAYLQARPTTTVQLTVMPDVTRSRNMAQYVSARTDALATATFGRRYVFAALDQTVVELATRLDWTFTPQLSLQLYARPFVVAGGFSDFKELRAPRTREWMRYGEEGSTIELGGACGSASSPDTYAIDPDGAGPAACFLIGRPDFNFRSLRGNAVLRWEYRPGSVLFFVWQQQRDGQEMLDDFQLSRDIAAMFDAPARNVFLVKATYWFGR